MSRKAKILRKTKETTISVDLNLDGKGKYKINTKIGFLDHMLEQLSKHSLIDMKVSAKGDTHIDLHHTTEDTGIAIGECLKKASKTIGGVQTQNAGTICGNICNASPAADSVPNLMALETKVQLMSVKETRVLPLEEFILGNRKIMQSLKILGAFLLQFLSQIKWS